MPTINLDENRSINVELGEQTSSLNTRVQDINYIPSYKEAETERRANEVIRIENEEDREEYIDDLKTRVLNGEFNGRDGAIQYTAGTGISISESNVISATGGGGGGTSNYEELSNKPKINNVELVGNLTTSNLGINIPTKTSDLTNDSSYITNAVNDLANYYKKSETYTQTEINTLIANVNSFNVEVVQVLPTSNIDLHTIYLLPKTAAPNDNYDEYIYINNSWEHIGSTEVDLTNYYTKTETDGLLSSKQNTLTAGSNIVINGNTISAEINVPSTNTIFAMYFDNTNQALLGTEPTAVTTKTIEFDTTEQYIDYTYTVPTNNFVLNPSSLYNLYLCLSGLSTVSGKKYSIKAKWMHGTTLVSESNYHTFEATTSNELIGIPMPTNYLTSNLPLNIGDTITLRIYYKTNYGDGEISILSGTGQQSAFVRNGAEVTANNVYDNFEGENHSQAYINHTLKNAVVISEEQPTGDDWKLWIDSDTDEAKYNNDGEVERFKVGDTLPVGTIVDYDGTTIPDGYEEVEDNEYDLTQYLFSENFNSLVRSKCIKKNGMVYMNVFTGYAISTGQANKPFSLFTNLPDELMPDVNIDFLVDGESTSEKHIGRGYINAASNSILLHMSAAPSSSYRYVFNVTYPVASGITTLSLSEEEEE